MSESENILLLKRISKSFGVVKALDEVTIPVKRGEIHSICGENGAGKSTLMKVLSGVYPAGTFSGEVFMNNRPCHFNNIRESEEKGIVIIHQELALVPQMSIAENIFLGNEIVCKYKDIDWNKTIVRARELCLQVGLTEDVNTMVSDIGVGKQQLVEIAKALSKNVKVLILDEPTAALNEKDSANLLDLLLKLQKNGITSIMISHKLNEVVKVSNSITIIRDGKTIDSFPCIDSDIFQEKIIKGMVGRELSSRYPERIRNIGSTYFEIKNWSVASRTNINNVLLKDINLKVSKGEVIGLSGLIGSGRTELALSMFGHSYGLPIKGQVIKDGKVISTKTIEEAVNNKIAYITEDRKGDGLILMDSICHNITLVNITGVSKNEVIDANKEIVVSNNFKKELSIKLGDVSDPVSSLSGGNQQKVLIAKWLYTSPDVLILDEPSRGIDVGAKYEIYSIINQLADEGKAVIIISSELPELIGMCDRIYIMSEGKINGCLDKKDFSQEKILSLAI